MENFSKEGETVMGTVHQIIRDNPDYMELYHTSALFNKSVEVLNQSGVDVSGVIDILYHICKANEDLSQRVTSQIVTTQDVYNLAETMGVKITYLGVFPEKASMTIALQGKASLRKSFIEYMTKYRPAYLHIEYIHDTWYHKLMKRISQ